MPPRLQTHNNRPAQDLAASHAPLLAYAPSETICGLLSGMIFVEAWLRPVEAIFPQLPAIHRAIWHEASHVAHDFLPFASPCNALGEVYR
jgi:hypothetical protein